MISITEILLNGSHDVTNLLLEKFERDGTLKINKHFDFSDLCEEEITQIVIEYVEDDNICYENQNLLDNKLLNSIFLPKSSNNNLFSIFIDKISEDETQHIQKLLTEQWTSYNTIVCFTFGAYQKKVYQELALKFDNSFLVFVNEYNFEFSSSNINLQKVSIAHCYWYTPYFINKLCFESCNVRPRILYYIGENNTSIINSMPVEFSKIIRFSSIDVMENLKKYMMVEHYCIELSSELLFESELMMLLYKNYFKELMGTKIIKKNYATQVNTMVPKRSIKPKEKIAMNDIVLIASTQYPRYGGAATCAYELHKYLLKHGFNSIIVFFDNGITVKNINVDPDNVGNVHHFKINKQQPRHSILAGMKQFYDREETASKIEHICGNRKPSTILAFNYLAPIIMRVLFPVSKVFFLITGSKVLSQKETKFPVTELHNDAYLEPDYVEKLAISCSNLTIPNSGISKNIFEHIYPSFAHKFGVTWDMFEIFEPQETTVLNMSMERTYDIVFICSRYDREIKNVTLIKELFEHSELKKYKKVCIGMDSNKYIKEREDIIHFGFLTKEDINRVLQNCKLILIPSFMESYSITNREALNNGCISLASSNVGNVYTTHKLFLCESVFNEYEWIQKINLLLSECYVYYRNLALKTYFDRSVKSVEFVKNVQEQPLSEVHNNGKKTILISSVDLPYIGGSGTNSYNILKHLNKLKCFNVYGIYFAGSKQRSDLDPDLLGNIHRLDIDVIDDSQLKKFAKTIPAPDIIFCKNYKILYALRCVFPKTVTIYSPSGLRYLTSIITKNPQYLRDIDTKNTKMIMDLAPGIEDGLKEVGIIEGMKKFDVQLDTYALVKCDIIVPNSSITYDILAGCEIDTIKQKLFRHISLTNISMETKTVDKLFKKRKYDIGFLSHSWKRACKNVNLMLEIIKGCPKQKCLIIGNDLKKELVPSNANYVGHMEHDTLLKELKNVKTVVMCSYYDSNPNTVIESLMQGCNIAISPNVGGYEHIDPSMVVEDYSNVSCWISCVQKSLNAQLSYIGPGADEIKSDIVELLNYASFKNNFVDKNTCVGIYKIPALMDEQFLLSAKPDDYSFEYAEDFENSQFALDTLLSDIYFCYAVEIADDNKYSTVHYITAVDTSLEKCVFYNMNRYYPVYTKRVFLWKVRNIYDVMNFRGAGLYFLRGTYHNTYGLLLRDNNDCTSLCYPATSVPFDNSNLRMNPSFNILDAGNVKVVTKAKYDIVLTNVDKNNYDKQYPDTLLLPFTKFAPDVYYLTNANRRSIDFIMVANATQSTKNHHLLHAFIMYVAERCKHSGKNYKFMYVGDLALIRKNYNLPSFGLYPSCITFENRNNVNGHDLRDLYNESKVNLLFSGRDAVPRVIFESAACGCYNVCLDTISDGKYFFDNPILGSLVGIANAELVKRPSKSVAYKDTNELWKLVYEASAQEFDHVKIATTYADTFSLKICADAVKELLV